MQVDPIKPKLKPPRSKRLKLKCDEPLSKFAVKFNLRRFTMARLKMVFSRGIVAAAHQCGAVVGRCVLTV